MSKKIFTKDQEKAIYTENKSILVSAGAGSGKTAVLVERIINKILNNKDVDIDKLLVVTFTDAAAAEMKQRIIQEIQKRLHEDPLNEKLKKQVFIINKASITTIHTFCKNIIKKFFYVIDIDPNFKIADKIESEILKYEAIDELFKEEYLKENNEKFLNLLYIYGNKYDDVKLKELILKIYDFSISSIDYKNNLLKWSENFNIKENNFEESIWVGLTKKYIKSNLEICIESLNNAIKICLLEKGPNKYIDILKEDIKNLENILNYEENLYYIYEKFINITFSKLPTINKKDNVDQYLKENVKIIRDNIKKNINNLNKKIFFKDINSLQKDILNLYPIIKKLALLTIDFSNMYLKKKKEKNILDFNDLEHFSLDILSNEEIASNLRNYYHEILVDEYQDSNLIQESILTTIAKKDNSNLFMVGDVKQSIYKFRKAKPELFLKKYEKFSENSDHGIKIDLSTNFRSRKIILDGINFIFGQLMSKETENIEYDNNTKLYFGGNFPKADDNTKISDSIEVNIINLPKEIKDEENADNIIIEAKFIAQKIFNLVNNKEDKLYIYEKNNNYYRPVEYKDIVILTRTVSSISEILIGELKNLNIPVFADSSGDYFDNQEVLTILNLLYIIDNPMQDIPLTSILYSYIYNFSPDELLEIKSILKEENLFNCINHYIKEYKKDNKNYNKIIGEKLQKFIKDLNKWRKISKYVSISKLISLLLKETCFFYYAGVMYDGNVKQNNLKILKEYAKKYEKNNYGGLFNFIKHVEKLIERDSKLSNKKMTWDNKNVVKIMSIHKSKGLEFPVVFVSILGRQFNLLDERQNIILHEDYGFGAKYINADTMIKNNTITYFSLVNKIHEELYGEELRILYVALTRAKEKLILTGYVSDLEKSIEKWSCFFNKKNRKLPKDYIIKSKCFLDFIMASLMRHRDSKNLFNTNESIICENKELYYDDSKWDINIIKEDDIKFSKILYEEKENLYEDFLDKVKLLEENKDLEKKLNWEYKYKEDIDLPSHLSISEIKRNYQNFIIPTEEEYKEKQVNFNLPSFIKKKNNLTKAEKGIALHTVMEHIDLHIHKKEEDIINLINLLYNKNILTEKEKESIRINKIINFINSDIACRMKKSDLVKKEIPFSMLVDPKDAFLKVKSSNKILLHGIIDCYFEENDKIILLDYKSDKVNNNIDKIIERYKIQILIYKKALENTFDKEVQESIIYLFDIDDYIKI